MAVFCTIATHAQNKNPHPAVHKVKHVTAGVKDRSSVSPQLCVTTGRPSPCHRFCLHYNFITGTSWVRGSIGRLSRPHPPPPPAVGIGRQTPACWTSSLIYSPCLSPPPDDIVEASPRTIWWSPLPERRPREIFHHLRPRRVASGWVAHPCCSVTLVKSQHAAHVRHPRRFDFGTTCVNPHTKTAKELN